MQEDFRKAQIEAREGDKGIYNKDGSYNLSIKSCTINQAAE